MTLRSRDAQVSVVNLSSRGAMIEADLRPNIGERLELHFANDSPVDCIVRWVKGCRIGVEFADETQRECAVGKIRTVRDISDDAIAAVPMDGEASGIGHRSAARHALPCLGKVTTDTQYWPARVCSICENGALVEVAGPMKSGSKVVLDLGKAGTIPANVIWTIANHVGLTFDHPFDTSRLAHKATANYVVTVYSAPGNYKPWARVEGMFSYRWKWQARIRQFISFRFSEPPHWIARWAEIDHVG